MEYKKMGVFSPCVNMDSASMINCLQALLYDYPSIKINSVTTDKKYKGFKIFFTEPEDSIVLEKNLLTSEERPIWIYPLTTFLIILDVDHKKTPLFERDLRDAINKKIGRVIAVLKTSNSHQSKNWRIEIDVPEFKGLEAFKTTNFSEIILPIRNEEVSLKFWCRQCEIDGHFQHECLSRDGEENDSYAEIRSPKMKSEKSNDNADKVGENSSSTTDRNSERSPKKSSSVSLETTEKYAEKIGREEVMSKHIQDDTHENAERSLNNNLPTETVIKQEVAEFFQDIDTKGDKNPRNSKSENPENYSNSKDIVRKNVALLNKSRDSISDDDDIRIIEDAENFSANKSPSNASNSSITAGARNFEEESRSPEMKNTSFPIFSFPSTAGPSHEFSSTALKTPRGAEVTTSLSERLQDCINEVCASVGVLDRKKLDAFLIHVKKKSNPIRVALNYTSNTKGLKEQLQGILHMYYNTPQTGTKEDIQFIKWLNGLVERYDGSIPKKRKRSGKTDDEPSAKR